MITTKRAYSELESEGFIETVPGKGSFVAAQNQELLREKRLRILEEQLLEVIDQARSVGLSQAELIDILELLYGDEQS